MTSRIQVYGTNWCRLTFGLREYLMHSGVDYDYFDIDGDSSADEFVRTMNDGKRKYPMVVIAERIVANPTFAELQRIIDET
jgi:glutaredoxin